MDNESANKKNNPMSHTTMLFKQKTLSSIKATPKIRYKKYKQLDGSTEVLVQKISDGSIITRFDKTPAPGKKTDVVCPHFLELKWATGCPYNCSWCYLKGTFRFLPYKTKPHLKNSKKTKEHIMAFLLQAHKPEILNSGELADSLMYEGNNHSFVNYAVPMFESQNKHKILLLTKSNRIKNLLKLPTHKQVIASFSLNAIPVALKWEKGAPSIKQRIVAMKTLFNEGYEIRVRIDPMVPINDWEKEYLELIDLLFDSLKPERITLGSLRGLQSTINNTLDKSWVEYLSENSNWGKKVEINARVAMYKKLCSYLKKKYKYSNVALCKETVAVWDILKKNYRKIRCNCIW